MAEIAHRRGPIYTSDRGLSSSEGGCGGLEPEKNLRPFDNDVVSSSLANRRWTPVGRLFLSSYEQSFLPLCRDLEDFPR